MNYTKKRYREILPFDWLIGFHALKYQDHPIEIEDLMQYGRIGTLKAERRFDKSRGVPINAYMGYYAKGYVQYGFYKMMNFINTPQYLKRKFFEIVDIDSMLEDGCTIAETINDRISMEHELEKKIDVDIMIACLDKLNPQEAQVLKLLNGIGTKMPLTLRATGEKLGVSHERVRQVEIRAMQRLKNFMRRERFVNRPLNSMREAFKLNTQPEG